MELKRETKVECWISSQNQEEIHFYADDRYLFGFNPKIISRTKVANFLSELGFQVDPKEWVD